MIAATNLATLGGGCFWCLEAVFQRVQGVSQAQSGYSGDTKDKAVYSKVSSGQTRHAEVVQTTFSNELLFKDILAIFFLIHDPTTMNKQGYDEGPQYRSVIFYHDEQQKLIALDTIKQLTDNKTYPNPIVTQVLPFQSFFAAEKDHNNYYNDNRNDGYCKGIIDPKVKKLFQKYENKVKTEYKV